MSIIATADSMSHEYSPLCSDKELTNTKRLHFMRFSARNLKKKLQLPVMQSFRSSKKSKSLAEEEVEEGSRRDSGCYSISTDGGSTSPQDTDEDRTDNNKSFRRRTMSLKFIRRAKENVTRHHKSQSLRRMDKNTSENCGASDSLPKSKSDLWDRAKCHALRKIRRSKLHTDSARLLGEDSSDNELSEDKIKESLVRSFSSDDVNGQLFVAKSPLKRPHTTFFENDFINSNYSDSQLPVRSESDVFPCYLEDSKLKEHSESKQSFDEFALNVQFGNVALDELLMDVSQNRKITKDLSYSVNDLFDVFDDC